MNKKSGLIKRLGKTCLCVMLSCLMVLGSFGAFATPAYAGVSPDPVSGLISSVNLSVFAIKWTIKTNDMALVAIFDALGDVTRMDVFYDVADWIKIESKDEKNHEEVMESLNEIKNMINNLQLDMHNLLDNISTQLDVISAKADSSNLSNYRARMSDFSSSSKVALDRYDDYIDAALFYGEAVDAYNQDPTDKNKNAMDNAAHTVTLRMKEFSDKAKLIDFETTLRNLATYSSSSYYTYSLTRQKVSQDSKNPVTSTLGYADLLADDGYAFEHMKYRFLLDELNWEKIIYSYVMQANRAWLEFLAYEQSLSIEERRELDPNLELDKRNLEQEKDTFETVLNLGLSYINDISEQFGELAGSLMREYDIDKTVRMLYFPSVYYDTWKTATFGTFHFKGQDNAKTTSQDMEFYMVKPINSSNNSTYLILKNGVKGPKTSAELVFFDSKKATVNKLNTAYYSDMTADFHNVMFTDDKTYSKYAMPYNMTEFNGLVNSSSFSLAGKNMLKYLVDKGGLDAKNLPARLDIGLLRDTYPAPDQPFFTTRTAYFFCHYYAANLSKYNANSPNDAKQDYQGSMDNSANNILVTLMGPDASTQEFSFTNSMNAQLSPAASSDNKYAPGTVVTGSHTPKGDSDKGIVLVGNNGEVLETLMDADKYEAYKDQNGKIEFVFSTPYQNFSIKTVPSSPTQPTAMSEIMSIPPDQPEVNELDSVTSDEPVSETDDEISIDLEKTDYTPVFTDIQDNPAKEDIEFLASHGIISGTGEGKFSPDKVMTRGMFAAALAKLVGSDLSEYRSGNFGDVSSKDPMRPYYEWAYSKGFLSGYGDWKFKPNEPITNEQMAVILVSFANRAGIVLPEDPQSEPYADDADISMWAKDAVYALKPSGVIKGDDTELFNPKGSLTRGQVATILAEFIRMAQDQ